MGSYGRYELIERIGIGGMAEVFRASQRGVAGFERSVAIKRILPHIAADPESIAMFVQEAKLAVQLSHPNIAQTFDLGEVDGSYFIAMEYVDGHSVDTLINRCAELGEPVPQDAICYILSEAAEGLHYAHFAEDSVGRPLGIIHRDVSPQNILLSFGGDVKVIDFGLAKAANRLSQTKDGIVKGKLAYLSPEQAHGKPIDRRSDVFALGVCAWEMLSGKRAFKRETDRETILAVRRGALERLAKHIEIPAALDLVIMRALAKNRDKRYRTALEMRENLRRFSRSTGSRFDRRGLRALMRRLFPERFAAESVDNVIALVTKKPRRRRARRKKQQKADKAARAVSTHEGLDDEITADDLAEPIPLAEGQRPPRELPAPNPLVTVIDDQSGSVPTWEEGTVTEPGAPSIAADTVPGIVLPEDR